MKFIQRLNWNERFSISIKNPNPNCSVGANIQSVLETEFTKVQQKMEEELKSITLADVIHEIEVKRDK